MQKHAYHLFYLCLKSPDHLMTTNSNRLDQLEALVEANFRAIDRNTANITLLEQAVAVNTANIDRNTANIDRNTANIARLEQAVAVNTANIDRNTADIAQLTADIRTLAAVAQTQQQTLQVTASALIEEIRGLRAENRRILAHLFGEPEN